MPHLDWSGQESTTREHAKRVGRLMSMHLPNMEAGAMYVENRAEYDIKCAAMTASHAMKGGGKK